MKSALLRLRESRDSMSATERSVSDYLLSHQGEAMRLSIHQLAERTFASPSTVIRMCQRIGFAGYKDFRQAVTCEVAVRRLDQERGGGEITRSDSLDEIVGKVTYKNIMALEDTRNMMDVNILGMCVELVKQARTVLLFGMGASLCAARDTYLKFLRLNKSCAFNDDWHAQYLQAKNSGQEDLGLVISDSGETAEVVECMRALRENGTPIIAITGRTSSSVAELSNYSLYAAGGVSANPSGAMASRLSQLNVIDILLTAVANSGEGYSLAELTESRAVPPPSVQELGLA